LLSVVAFIFILTPVAQAADVTSPKKEMEKTIAQLVDLVEKYPGDDNLSVRHEQMREVIGPKFDFDEMAKRSLGAQWKKITPTERQEFVDLFSELLATTYLGRIENVERNMVTVDEEKLRMPRALVKTTVDYKGDLFPIDYKLINSDKGWRVYDVIIENIGLVANYRSEFAGIIRKNTFTGLLDKLRKKNAGEEEAS
ncbi:MAG: ABC transporter substrate-binding protein, partial [Bdellovibrionales bacterium]|nr:ABC transporter substrate-binding protein [Bdellovibrionales bacterium]